MKIIESVKEMQEYSRQLKREGKTIASVDTDAELHDGHRTLVKIAKENADVVVLSAGHSVNSSLG
jgi:pantoate--beta-alanine ligase